MKNILQMFQFRDIEIAQAWKLLKQEWSDLHHPICIPISLIIAVAYCMAELGCWKKPNFDWHWFAALVQYRYWNI